MEKMKKRREALKLTQAQLAQKIGAGLTTIRHWEHGRRWPERENLLKLAKALRCAPANLL
jgi:transcriptional regulator with XRE-family HTH domain